MGRAGALIVSAISLPYKPKTFSFVGCFKILSRILWVLQPEPAKKQCFSA